LKSKIETSLRLKAKGRFISGLTKLTLALFTILSVLPLQSCKVYSFSGISTPAKTITVTEFYNNADLGPANMGQVLTNDLKNYFIQNSSISVVVEEGELQIEGEITDFRLTPIAPVSTGDPNQINNASSTRLTISVRATFINTLDDTMSFKDKSFSFYKDFTNDQNFADIEEQYTKQIFERIINDIFNASVANW
jgi:Lipopolysaccharide-assembly